MFKRECAILVVFIIAIILILPFPAFAVEKQDKDAILQEIGAFIDKAPNAIRPVIFSIADEYVRVNKIDEAIALYEKALKILPSNEDLLGRLASLYNRKEDYLKSADIYKKMIELKPENIWYYNVLSDTYKNAKLDDKAIALWEDLMKKSNNPDIFVQAANFYNNRNNTEGAVLAVKKAIELKPDNAAYQQTLESYYIKLEKFSDAEAICNKILTSTKDTWMKGWADSELINIYKKQNKLPELAVRFEKDLAQAPKELSGYRKLAELYQRNNERDKAIEVYEKAVGLGSDDKDINMRFLDLCENSERFDKAEAQIKRIIASNPQDFYLYERLANIFVKAKKVDEAKKTWQQLLEKVPNDAGTFLRFGDRLNEWGDTNEAIQQYRKAQSLDTHSLRYTMRVADLLVNQGKIEDAKKELNDIIAKATDDWTKKEAERKVKDLEVKRKEAVSLPSTAVVTSPKAQPGPVPKEKIKQKAPSVKTVPAEKATKPAKKKGWFR
nr:tetratricopeptide repeat protein [Candidatus Omnitrophota bacterium]